MGDTPGPGRLDDNLLTAFMRRFYGYGDYAAPIWFVGMEEAGGDSLGAISQRLTAWDQLGQNELEDVVRYHAQFGVTEFWDEPVKLHSTWKQLIRLQLSAHGQTAPDLKAYQRDVWGRHGSKTCLIELFPLPSPSTAHWLYASLSALPDLADRKTYRQSVSEARCRHIRASISQHRPRAVVFYGLAYLNYWQEIAGGSLEWEAGIGAFLGRNGDTSYVVAKHPAARGVTNVYFEALGKYLGAASS